MLNDHLSGEVRNNQKGRDREDASRLKHRGLLCSMAEWPHLYTQADPNWYSVVDLAKMLL